MDGLKMKGGREINERPDGETGIAMAARLRSEFKSSKTVRNIADGIELAEQKKVANEAMMKSLKNFMKL
tara:strand:- start:557 stop:763 length:207 start_codon:yes stop_codon:yes gene_type:complete